MAPIDGVESWRWPRGVRELFEGPRVSLRGWEGGSGGQAMGVSEFAANSSSIS